MPADRLHLVRHGEVYNPDRVLLAFVQSAARAGAVVANHVAVTGFLRTGAVIAGVTARDGIGGADLEIRARVTVNAAGAWANDVGRLAGEDHLVRPDSHEGGVTEPVAHFLGPLDVGVLIAGREAVVESGKKRTSGKAALKSGSPPARR